MKRTLKMRWVRACPDAAGGAGQPRLVMQWTVETAPEAGMFRRPSGSSSRPRPLPAGQAVIALTYAGRKNSAISGGSSRRRDLASRGVMKRVLVLLLAIAAVAPATRARAENGAETAPAAPEDWSVHGQTTVVEQGYPHFHAPFVGPNSLDPGPRTRETITGTAFLGGRLPWEGGELYFNPEFNQGFGLSHTLGIDGFPNGEAQKGGFNTPKPNVARLFLRQTFGLGGEPETLEPAANQLGTTVDVSRVTVTVGKMTAPDIFDGNQYAHDPRTTFLNWSIWESAAWDYPADQKGYTDGLAVELNQKDWALRGGWFLVPTIANQRDLEGRFWKRYGTVAELELRQLWFDTPGVLRLLAFANRARMGNLRQAVALASGTPADISAVRRDRWKAGFAVNLEQSLAGDLGLFAKLSWNDGRTEGWAFTDIDRSLTLGVSLKGTRWGRPNDTVGLAGAVNALSKAHQLFFANGGTGILAGDGALDYAPEGIVETYYNLRVFEPLSLILDYQFVANPAFNGDRGPVHVLAARAHVEF
jgi:high affinity Mn2+ porin